MSAITSPILTDDTFATKMDEVIAAMTKQNYTLTVTAQTNDSVTVTGQVVTVRSGGASGPVYATAAYEGQPVSFSLPQGFHYYVSVSDSLYRHYLPTYAEGVINGANVSVVLTYHDFSNITTGPGIKAALNADADLTELVGEQITCAKGSDTLTWDVVDFDSAHQTVTLKLHGTCPEQMQFDTQNALAYFDVGLAAGDYSFKNGNTSYYFTLTQAIPSGGQLRATTSVFQTYASQSSTAAIEEGIVSTTAIAGATELGKCGTEEGTYPLNHMDRVNYGSNNGAESRLKSWLNSDADAYTPMPNITKFQRPYIPTVAGFMKDLDSDFIESLDDTEWKCATNTTYECPASMGGLTTRGNRYTVTAKFWLASEKEIFGSQQGTSVEAGDAVFDYYKNAAASDRIERYNNSARFWWLRSPYSNAGSERYVNSGGTVNGNVATSSYGVVPACKISKSS